MSHESKQPDHGPTSLMTQTSDKLCNAADEHDTMSCLVVINNNNNGAFNRHANMVIVKLHTKRPLAAQQMTFGMSDGDTNHDWRRLWIKAHHSLKKSYDTRVRPFPVFLRGMDRSH
jgi:hypothetical protein